MKEVETARWSKLSPLLDELLDLDDATAQAARLAQIARDDPALADELVALLARRDRIEREGFLEGSALGQLDPTLAGQTLGAYTLEDPLGAGGMGSVWLARRSDGRYEGKAAVKLLNLALVARGGAERFAREGSLLARLAHPNIARLLDAGVAAGGQPYLVLEHVEGEPIDRWCDAQGLDVNGRLRLFLQVLAAVSHAHSRLILHRDLKPSNILVTRDGQIKLLDFGIAKLLEGERQTAEPTELTALGHAFTPGFAAPEQLQRAEVTTATDVYALGVLLHVLLTGTHPTVGSDDTPLERMRALLEREPTAPSQAARQAGAAAAGARAASPAQLARVLRGDLDNIVAKALKKAPAARYLTVDALADDVLRHLNHEPVAARADSFAYRAGKFVRRHRLAVSAASATLLVLLAGIAGTTWQAIEAQRQRADALAQRDRAQTLLDRNEAIVEFVKVMFTEAVPKGEAAAIRQMLERSEPLVSSMFAGQPAHQGEILRVLSSYHTALNQPNKVAELLARAREVVEGVPDRSLKARLACTHADALRILGRNQDAATLIEPWMDAPDIEATVAASCMQSRAILALEALDPQAALRHAQAALERIRRGSQARAPLLEATLLGDIGHAQFLTGRNVEADRSHQTALQQLHELGRGQQPEAIRLTVSHGLVRYAMSDYKGGLELFERALHITEARGDAMPPPSILGNQAFGYEQLGRYPEALAAYDRTLAAARSIGGAAGQAYALVGRASVLAAMGNTQQAQPSLDGAAELLPALPAAHTARIRSMLTQAHIDAFHGRLDSADEHVARVIDVLSSQGVVSPWLARAHRQRSELALRRGDTPRAIAAARNALDLARTLQGSNPHSELTGLASLTLARALHETGDAVGSQQALSTARAELLQTLGASHPETRSAGQLLDRK
jgi:serine/threonine-protein kinase